MTQTSSKQIDEQQSPDTDTDDVLWLAFATTTTGQNIVRGPYTTESAALESVPEDNSSFHLEPRRTKEDGSESCFASDIHPTY